MDVDNDMASIHLSSTMDVALMRLTAGKGTLRCVWGGILWMWVCDHRALM